MDVRPRCAHCGSDDIEVTAIVSLKRPCRVVRVLSTETCYCNECKDERPFGWFDKDDNEKSRQKGETE